jgi:hypothetical protein
MYAPQAPVVRYYVMKQRHTQVHPIAEAASRIRRLFLQHTRTLGTWQIEEVSTDDGGDDDGFYTKASG